MVSKLIRQQPLVAEGLERVRLPASSIPFGDVGSATQRLILSKGVSPPVYRNQIAQYIRSAYRNPQYLSGSPRYYPESQMVNIQVPGQRPVPAHYGGKMDMSLIGKGMQPMLTPRYNLPGLKARSSFMGDTLTARGIPLPHLPGVEEMGKF